MSYENVKLWFAKNENDNIITIDEINEENKHNVYHCPVCGSDLTPSATKSTKVTPHFKHVDTSKCNSESQIHFWFKHKFLEKGDKFTVFADKERDYMVKDIKVEQSYNTENGIYRPDVTIQTECGNVIYFEMTFSNKKKIKDYLDIWLELKNIVVEVDLKQLANKDEMPTFKALFYDGKCFNTKRNDTYYNTIGKYKEEKLKDSIDEELKERIRKLDWFWEDVFKYKKGEVDIKHMVWLIDTIDGEENKIITNILNKQSCNQLREDYHEYHKKQYKIKFQEVINNIDKKYDNRVKIKLNLENYCPSYTVVSNFRNSESFNYIGSHTVTNYNISIEYHLDYIESQINSELNDVEKINERDKITKNPILHEVIDEINKEFKEIDINYELYLNFKDYSFNCQPYNICINKKYSNEHDYIFIDITGDKLFASKNKEEMKQILRNKLAKDRERKNLIKNINEIKVIVDEICSNHKKITKDIYYKELVKTIYDSEERIQVLICRPTKHGAHDFKIEITNNKISIYVLKYGEGFKLKDEMVFDNMYKFKKIFMKEFYTLADNIEKQCYSCFDSLFITINELEFYNKKGLKSPKRCKSCRDKRKQNKLIKNN